MNQRELEEARQRFRYGTPEGVSGRVGIRAEMRELGRLSDEQRAAWLNGIAEIVAAANESGLMFRG